MLDALPAGTSRAGLPQVSDLQTHEDAGTDLSDT